MLQLSVQQLHQMLAAQTPMQLIDVREAFEHEAFSIGGELAPLSELPQHLELFNTTLPIVVYCRKGIRSAIAIQRVADRFPGAQLFNLQGGMEAWQRLFPNDQ
jgi:adenylyltransferase/sulfurtransferase